MHTSNLLSENQVTECRKVVFTVISFAIIILSTYSNTFHVPWQFDDAPNILERQEIHLNQISGPQIKATFFNKRGKLYRPIACLSLAFNYYLGQKNVFGYHLVNILVHFISSIFLFLFIYNTLNLPSLKPKYGQNAYFIALLAAVLWAINPVQTQGVTYIVQRMASMAAMFYIMSMTFYIKARTSDTRPKQIIYFILCTISGILAFGSKENSALLPFVILLFDILFIQGPTIKNIKKNLYILLIVLLIPILAALILKGVSILDLINLFGNYTRRNFTLTQRMLTEPRIIIYYISLLFYPMPNRLNITHDISLSYSLLNPWSTLISIILIVGMISFALMKARRMPLISFCILFFFINHLIESTIFPLELIFEHRNYLPSMLFFVPIAILMLRAIRFFSANRRMSTIIIAFIILIMVGYGHGTFVRNHIWRSEEGLWLDAMDKSPNLRRPHLNLVKYYFDTGQMEKAIHHCQVALTLKEPSYGDVTPMIYYDLARIYLDLNKRDEAIRFFEKSVDEENPVIFPMAYANLGKLFIEKCDYHKAYHYLIKGLTYDEKSWILYYNLGLLFFKEQRYEQAIISFKNALALNNDALPCLEYLGIIYKNTDRLAYSIICFRKVLQKAPQLLRVHLHLAESHILAGHEDIAKQIIEDALEKTAPQLIHSNLESFMEDRPKKTEYPSVKKILAILQAYYYQKMIQIQETETPPGE